MRTLGRMLGICCAAVTVWAMTPSWVGAAGAAVDAAVSTAQQVDTKVAKPQAAGVAGTAEDAAVSTAQQVDTGVVKEVK